MLTFSTLLYFVCVIIDNIQTVWESKQWILICRTILQMISHFEMRSKSFANQGIWLKGFANLLLLVLFRKLCGILVIFWKKLKFLNISYAYWIFGKKILFMQWQSSFSRTTSIMSLFSTMLESFKKE